jgi:hypothetical protein
MTKSVAVKFGSGDAFQNCVSYTNKQAPKPAGPMFGLDSSLLRPTRAVSAGMPFCANHAGAVGVSHAFMKSPSLNGFCCIDDGATGKVADGETVAEGFVVAEKRSNVRGAK